MKVLIINHNGGSIYHGPNLRTYYASKALIERGHNVTVVSSSFSHKYVVPPKVTGVVTAEDIDGINFKWIQCITYTNLIERIYSHFEFGFKLYFYRRQICTSADLVIFSGPPPELFLFASKFAKYLRAPIISDVRDFWPPTQIEMSIVNWFNPYTYFLYVCQLIMFSRSKHIVSPLSGASDYIRKINGKTKISIIENGYDIDSNVSVTEPVLTVTAAGVGLDLRPKSALELGSVKAMNRFVIGYSGSFDRDNDLDSLLEAASRLKHRQDILFMFVGGGLREDDLIRASNTIDNLLVCERVESRFVKNVLEVMDVCYCGLKRKNIYRYGVSLAKSYEYMAARRPLIWMIHAHNNIVKDSGGGFTVEPGDVDQLTQTIELAASLEDSELCRLGDKGYEYMVSNCSYRVLGGRWHDLVQSCAE